MKSINILFQIMSTQGSAQMFYMKQAAYRARKKKKENTESTEQKTTRKIRARLRYIKDTKLPAVEAKLKSLKDDIRKRLSKKQKESLMAKIKKLTKERRALKSEESKLNKHTAVKK